MIQPMKNQPLKQMPRPCFRYRSIYPAFLLVITTLMGGACGKDKKETCTPEEEAKERKFQVFLQPTEDMNLGVNGEPLPTFVRVYQLDKDVNLYRLKPEDLREDDSKIPDAKVLDKTEILLNPKEKNQLELSPDENASHLMLMAFFRQPMGNKWYETIDISVDDSKKACKDKKAKKEEENQEKPSSCVFVLVGRNQIDSGLTPPSGFDRKQVTIKCAPPPMRRQSAKQEDDDKKKDKSQ